MPKIFQNFAAHGGNLLTPMFTSDCQLSTSSRVRQTLLDDLRNSPWDSAFIFDEIDDICDALDLISNKALKSHILCKQKRVKKIKQPTWINADIVSAIKKRDNELKKARKSNSQDDWAKYKGTKCFVTD